MRFRLERDWLHTVVAEELDRHDPAAALAGLPPDVRDAGAAATDLTVAARLLVARSLRRRRAEQAGEVHGAFLENVRLHVALVLDLRVLRGSAFDAATARAEIAAFLAAALGETGAALAVPLSDAATGSRAAGRAVHRALSAAGAALAARFLPHGDPVLGLPLHSGYLALVRRRIARTAAGFHRHGGLDRAALDRLAAYAEQESVLLAEVLAGLLLAAAPPDPRTLAIRQRQLARLGLSRAALRAARTAVAAPRPPGEIAAAAPARMLSFLAEHLFLAVLDADLPTDGSRAFVEGFVSGAPLDAAALAAAQVEAAARHGSNQAWFEPGDAGSPIMSHGLAGDWDVATDVFVERVSTVVTENLDSLVTEIRQTGELGHLLARAAAGATLTPEERRKVRAQLIDLAKAVPALAIFAAPGGMLLLPLLAKLLPFNLLPSAWDRAGAKKVAPAEGAVAPKKTMTPG